MSKPVKLISCGEFVTASEKMAVDYLKSELKSDKNISEGIWYLVTNVSISSKNNSLPYEVDILIIGPTGVFPIEVKHWDQNSVNSTDSAILSREAEKIDKKAKIIKGKLQRLQRLRNEFIEGRFLLTGNKKEQYIKDNKRIRVYGIPLYGLLEWTELLGIGSQTLYRDDEIESIYKELVPHSQVYTPHVRKFGSFKDLELLKKARLGDFRRTYRATRAYSGDKVTLHLYDLSAIDKRDARNVAERESIALRKLRLFPFIPEVIDYFQDLPTYPGELCFFTYADPLAPSLNEHAKDHKWSIEQRIYFTKHCIEALRDLHQQGESNDPILHRNINPDSIKVTSENKPIFTQFQFARLPNLETVAGSVIPEFQGIEAFIAPEVLAKGLSDCTITSDIYSLCSTLLTIFPRDWSEKNVVMVRKVIEKGLLDNPSNRPTLNALLEEMNAVIQELSQQELNPDFKPDPEKWDENTIKEFRGRHYRIITRLGTGE